MTRTFQIVLDRMEVFSTFSKDSFFKRFYQTMIAVRKRFKVSPVALCGEHFFVEFRASGSTRLCYAYYITSDFGLQERHELGALHYNQALKACLADDTEISSSLNGMPFSSVLENKSVSIPAEAYDEDIDEFSGVSELDCTKS